MGYPKIDEEFELTLDGSDPNVQPLAMVKNYGYNPEGWKHDGPLVKGQQTQKFKLVQKGGTWDEIGKVVGGDLEGQWLEAFRAQYPESDGEHPVGVHDASWVSPNGRAGFPCVSRSAGPGFGWTDNDFFVSWLWLVPVK